MTASMETLENMSPLWGRLMTGKKNEGTESETVTGAERETETVSEETAETGIRSEESEIERGKRTAGIGTETGIENVRGKLSEFVIKSFINLESSQEHFSLEKPIMTVFLIYSYMIRYSFQISFEHKNIITRLLQYSSGCKYHHLYTIKCKVIYAADMSVTGNMTEIGSHGHTSAGQLTKK